MTDIPHFALPFQWATAAGGGLAAAETEQETVAEIGDCVEVVIRTTQGERTTLPDFGIPQLEFNVSADLTRTMLASCILQWEPRVQALIDAGPDPQDETVQQIRALISPQDNEEGDAA